MLDGITSAAMSGLEEMEATDSMSFRGLQHAIMSGNREVAMIVLLVAYHRLWHSSNCPNERRN